MNDVSKQDGQQYDDGRNAATAAFKKMHQSGPQQPDSLLKRPAPVADTDPTLQMLKSHQARGPDRLLPGTIADAPAFIAKSRDETVLEIHKAHESPRQLSPLHARQVDPFDIEKIIADGRMKLVVQRLRKLRKSMLPPQSDNAQYDDTTADAGADGSFSDEAAPSATATQFGTTRHAQSISAGRLPASQADGDATVNALRRIFAGGPKRF